METKLELRHIAPYLPWGLNWDISETKYGKIEKHRLEFCVLTGINGEDELLMLKTNIKSQNSGLLIFKLHTGKPILRPLSDLINEIEGIGTPIIELFKLIQKVDYIESPVNGEVDFDTVKMQIDDGWNHVLAFNNGLELSYSSHGSFNMYCDDWLSISNQLELFQKLFEWNFDVFNLIQSGLAIDINSIKP